MKYFIILMAMGLLAACASNNPTLSCEGTNWYELGRQTGRQGQDLEDSWDLRKICGEDRGTYTQKFAILETGYQAGLAEYCSPENAFNLGRLGLKAQAECPHQFQEAYLEAHKKGQSYSKLKASNMDTDRKIKMISSELGEAGLSLAKRALREGQRLDLLEKKNGQLGELKALQESAESSLEIQ